jgi:hypothetical protein
MSLGDPDEVRLRSRRAACAITEQIGARHEILSQRAEDNYIRLFGLAA